MAVDPQAGGPARAMHSVEGRVIIVTGSGQGVGRGMANHLGKAGASVVVAEWNAEKMHRTVDELDRDRRARDRRRDRHPLRASRSTRWSARTVEHFGKVDAIVNNAQTFRRERARSPRSSAEDVDVFYQSGRARHALRDAGRLPAHEGGGVGPHRQLRVVDGSGRRCRVRRVQRVEGGDPRACRAPRRASGPPTASSSTSSRRPRRRRARSGASTTRSSCARADGPQRRPRARHRPGRALPLLRRLPLPHRPDVHGRRRQLHVVVSVRRADATEPSGGATPTGGTRGRSTGVRQGDPAPSTGRRPAARRRLPRRSSTSTRSTPTATPTRTTSTTRRRSACSTSCASPTSRRASLRRGRGTCAAGTSRSSSASRTCCTRAKAGCTSASSVRPASPARRGKAGIVEQRAGRGDERRGRSPRAWFVQLLVAVEGVVDWPDWYWEMVAGGRGRTGPGRSTGRRACRGVRPRDVRHRERPAAGPPRVDRGPGSTSRRSAATRSGRQFYGRRCCEPMAADARAGGPVFDVLAPHAAEPFERVYQLRLLGGVHRIVLEGRAPGLGAPLPVGRWRRRRRRGVAPVPRPASPPRPPEVRRRADATRCRPTRWSARPRSSAGSSTVARETGLPLRVLELGVERRASTCASTTTATSRTARASAPPTRRSASSTAGPTATPPFDVAPRGGRAERAVTATRSTRRPRTAALTLLSYLWPGQDERFETLRGRARRRPPRSTAPVERADLARVARRPARRRRGPASRRSCSTRSSGSTCPMSARAARSRARIARRAGERATADAPARLAPARAAACPASAHPELRLTLWPGGERAPRSPTASLPRRPGPTGSALDAACPGRSRAEGVEDRAEVVDGAGGTRSA